MGRGSIREIVFSSSKRFEEGMLFLDIFINDNTRGINFFSQQTLKFQSISEEIILQPFFFVYIILYYMPNFRIAKYHSPPRSTKRKKNARSKYILARSFIDGSFYYALIKRRRGGFERASSQRPMTRKNAAAITVHSSQPPCNL